MGPLTQEHPPPGSPTISRPPPGTRRFSYGKIVAAVLVLSAIAAVVFCLSHWPFTKEKLTATLQQHISGKVQIGKFRRFYLPKPGCVAEDIIIQGISKDPAHPMATIQALRIEADYHSAFTASKRIDMYLTGLHVWVPAAGERADGLSAPDGSSGVIIQHLEAPHALLEIQRKDDAPLKFAIHELTLGPILADQPMAYRVALTNPLPVGEIAGHGTLGPWRGKSIDKVPVQGEYRFNKVDLGVFSAIQGTLNSSGSFNGPLAEIVAHGSTHVDHFEIRKAGHPVTLDGTFDTLVDGTNGDVTIRDSSFSWEQTTLQGSGTIAARPGAGGKFTDLRLNVRRGRIQDLMLLTKHGAPTMDGPVALTAKAFIPPTHEKFLKRLQFSAQFAVDHATFTKPGAQAGVDKLSERARGEKGDEAARVLSSLRGNVDLRNGVAHFSNATFTVPEAVATFKGDANLLNKNLNFAGRLRMAATLSQATSGFKSVFLKVLDPFFKNRKQHAGSDLPVTMTGLIGSPKFGVSLFPRK